MLAGIRADHAAGLTVLPLADAIDRFEDRLRPLIEAENINGASRAFAALNTAFLEHGLVIHVAQGVDAGSLLLRWAFSPGEASRMGHFRMILLLENGARIRLVEQFQSSEATANALNVIIQAELGEGAELSHVRLQAESADATLLTSTSIGQAAGSTYSYRGFDLGCGLARHELNTQLSGPEAYADISGAFVLDGRRHVDNHVSVSHEATDCRSEQFFRGVLGGRSRGVFNGRALIQPGADGSSVQQSNANLLLSDLAEMDTKPELEIYADEVEASHGATVGQLDENAVFYMRSRGLSSAEARRMLTAAFCHAVTDRLQDRELASRIAGLVDAAMPGDGES
jgi:Fe-S cluster assembly protein SufD